MKRPCLKHQRMVADHPYAKAVDALVARRIENGEEPCAAVEAAISEIGRPPTLKKSKGIDMARRSRR